MQDSGRDGAALFRRRCPWSWSRTTAFLTMTVVCLGTITMAAAATSLRPDLAENYDKLCRIKLSNGLPVEKYVSKRTGMHIILAKVDGPLVSGYFTLATETHDDDGLPHTLEHLVFLGSEKYPYKGVLDLLANRCLASGTNAWTDVDHTAYTIETAGSEGFLNHLPVYLDHLLYPTLTEAGFTTEVHHLTGEGEDAGVVYSEMQSRENTANDRIFLAMQRALYPKPCGYRQETGGLMANLRNSTTNEKIRAYHKAYYRPENLHLIIAGNVDIEPVLDALMPFEDRVVAKGPRPPFERPWQMPVLPLTETIRTEVLYPSQAQDNGKVIIAWRAPSAVNNFKLLMALEVLLEFLTYSSVSPLPAAFVETDQPLASEVTQYCMENQASNCYLKFSGVPVDVMEEVEPLLRQTLNAVYAEGGLGVDLSAMQEVLQNLILTEQSDLETSPRDTLAYAIISDVLYGNTCQDLKERLDKITWYRELLTKPLQYWLDLLRVYFLEQPSVVVLARPSQAEAERLELEESDRVQQRIDMLGVEGLHKQEELFNTAKEYNEIPPPPAMLSSLPIPSPSSVTFHTLVPYSNLPRLDATLASLPLDHPSFNLSRLPICFQLDDVQSNFVSLTAILDTSRLSASQRLYLPLLLELLFESGVMRGGTEELSYETVVRRLSADLISTGAELGLSVGGVGAFSCGPFCNYAILIMKVEASKYALGVSWLHDVLYHLRPTVSRLKVKTNKLLNSIADDKRSGPKIMALMHKGVMFDPESNHNQVNLIRQQAFLLRLSARLLDEADGQAVLEEVMETLHILAAPDSIAIHMATNVSKLAETQDVEHPWQLFVQDKTFKSGCKRLHVVVDSDFRSFTGPPKKSARRLSQGRGKAISDDSDGNTFNNSSSPSFNRLPSDASVNSVKETGELSIHNGDDRHDDLAGHDDALDKVDNENTTTVETALLLRGVNATALTEEEETDGGEGMTSWVTGLASADSGYLQQSALCLSHHTHWDLPALMTAIQYFTQYEGPMWREIRGKGLAYNYNLQLLPSEGLITLKLLRAAQLMEAYTETITMLNGHINGSIDWQPLLLESAKSSLLFEVIYREETVSDGMQQSLLAYYRRVPHSYNRDLLSHISRVTMADVQRVSAQYFGPLIDPASSRTVLVCHPSEVPDAVATLVSLGHQVEVVENIKESRFA